MPERKARTISEKQIRHRLAWKQPVQTDTPREQASFPYLAREKVIPKNWIEEPEDFQEPASPEDLDRRSDESTGHKETSEKNCKRNEN